MKNIFTVLVYSIPFVIASFFVADAQGQDAQKGNAKISGSVIDTETNLPVEFANVALLDPETGKPVNGAVCDDKGIFTITKVAEGNYSLSASFIGYETQTLTSVVVDKRSEISLGVIKLSTGAKILKEVVVEGQKDLIEERVDRMVYNAENDQTTRGGDATDVLKRVPLLSVDMDGNVTLRGSQNITVLINNKPSTIMASSIADALKQIPADQIKNVEVITSPSAKYDAEGSGGIINIITKKNTLEGATLGFDAGIGLRGSNLGLNGNYRTGKMGFSLGGWGRTMYNVLGSFENSQLTRDPESGNTVLNTQRADTKSRGLFGNYNLGWDYDIDKNNILAASVRFGARSNINRQQGLLTESYINDVFNQSNLRNVRTNDINNTVDVNLTYTHLYEKPQKELSFMALYSKNNRNNDFTNSTIEQNGVPSLSSFKNLNDSYNQEMTLQADYQTPISTNQMFEMGAKDIIRKAYSDFSYLIDANGSGDYVVSDSMSLTNNLNYDQNIASGYVSYTLNLKSGYSMKAGTRYEYTTIDANTRTEQNIDIPSYGVLVPSINFSKKLTKGGMVKLAYNRRIQRPSIRFLNPNVQSSNQINIEVGNPELRPEFSNNYELSYSTFVKGISVNVTSFYRNTTGSIQRVRTAPDANGVVTTTYQNIGTEDAYGASAFFNINLGKVSLNAGSDVYYNILDNNIDTRNEGWVVSGRMFGGYNLNNGWGIQAFGFMRGRQVQLQGWQGGFGMYSLGVKKDFKDKKGSIGFGAENFFTNGIKVRSKTSTEFIDQSSLNVMRNLSFRVNISYRIGKMNVEGARPKRRRSIDNDDLKEGDGGGMDAGGGGGGGQRQGGGGGGNVQQGSIPTGNDKAKKPSGLPLADSIVVVKVEGTWNYTVESPQGATGNLVITKTNDVYTGTITTQRSNEAIPLTSVTVNGDALLFEYNVTGQVGTQMTIKVRSIITGDDLAGDMTVGDRGTFPVKAKRSQ